MEKVETPALKLINKSNLIREEFKSLLGATKSISLSPQMIADMNKGHRHSNPCKLS